VIVTFAAAPEIVTYIPVPQITSYMRVTGARAEAATIVATGGVVPLVAFAIVIEAELAAELITTECNIAEEALT
jgi:hypothetical protein